MQKAEKPVILVVDDDPVQRRLLDGAVGRIGYHAITVPGGREALQRLKGPDHGIAAIVLDLIMPEMDGIGVLKHLEENGVGVPVIVQTAQGGIDTVVNAMRAGAFDFVVKPVSPARLQQAIENALKVSSRTTKKRSDQAPVSQKFGFADIITTDPKMQAVLKTAEKAATSQIPILIEGESGVGKELIARAIQSASPRSGQAFVTVNCGALPENLVESILFGHEKGAFTGAAAKHIGKFEEADGGTLFLDEIGELPLDIQVKLLRALQEGEIDPVGASKPVKVNVRVVSATNRDLFGEVGAGRFREDLYYRLNVLPLTVPPLRERKDDIAPLAIHFMHIFVAEEKRTALRSINPQAMAMLRAHDWPGNIRQLENAMFRAVVLCEGNELTSAEFPQIAAQMQDFELPSPAQATAIPQSLPEASATGEVGQETAPPSDQANRYGMLPLISQDGDVRQLEEIEAEVIRFAIEIYRGRMTEVARRLGIGRSTLYRKLKDYDLEDRDTSSAA